MDEKYFRFKIEYPYAAKCVLERQNILQGQDFDTSGELLGADVSISEEQWERAQEEGLLRDAYKNSIREGTSDTRNRASRNALGFCGISAISNFFNLRIHQRTWEHGRADNYDISDWFESFDRNIHGGIKTISLDAPFPAIKEKDKHEHQLILIQISKLEFKILGIAEPKLLVDYSSEEGILYNEAIKRKGKHGFFGISKIHQRPDIISEVEEICGRIPSMAPFIQPPVTQKTRIATFGSLGLAWTS